MTMLAVSLFNVCIQFKFSFGFGRVFEVMQLIYTLAFNYPMAYTPQLLLITLLLVTPSSVKVIGSYFVIYEDPCDQRYQNHAKFEDMLSTVFH